MPMSKVLVLTIASALLMLIAVWAQPPRPREGNLKVGDPAPDFTLSDGQGKITVKLSALKGKPVALFFGSCT